MTPSLKLVKAQTLQYVVELSHCEIGTALTGLLIVIGLVKEIELLVLPLRGS